MSTLTQRIVDALKPDGTIQFHCAQRVYPFDIRTAGPQARTGTTDENGYQLPTICVDDQGSLRNPLAPSGTAEGVVAIWILAEREYGAANGAEVIDALVDRIIAILHRWQDATTKTYLTFAGRLGQQYDPAPGSGMLDRLDFKAASVLMTARQ